MLEQTCLKLFSNTCTEETHCLHHIGGQRTEALVKVGFKLESIFYSSSKKSDEFLVFSNYKYPSFYEFSLQRAC
jgi:hypothetical protein